MSLRSTNALTRLLALVCFSAIALARAFTLIALERAISDSAQSWDPEMLAIRRISASCTRAEPKMVRKACSVCSSRLARADAAARGKEDLRAPISAARRDERGADFTGITSSTGHGGANIKHSSRRVTRCGLSLQALRQKAPALVLGPNISAAARREARIARPDARCAA